MKYNFLKSFCKINLFLEVGSKNKKTKLHNIQSIVFIINLKDEIKIKRIYDQKDIIKFTGPFSKYIKNKKNSLSESLFLLRKAGYIKKNYNYYIFFLIQNFMRFVSIQCLFCYTCSIFVRKFLPKPLGHYCSTYDY